MSRVYEEAIKREVEEWPGVAVEFVPGGKHPKAKFKFDGKVLSRPYSGTPGDAAFGLHQMLGDMRRTMKQLGAERIKPEPSREEDEAPYRKPNDGAAKRPPPVKGEAAKVKPTVADQFAAQGLVTTEEDEPEGDDAADRRAEIAARAGAIEDGIYFGLPEEVYHAVPRLSASGLQNMLVSPATFWAKSWLNPDKAEAKLDEDATDAMLLGKAYHCARLEPERFASAFCRKPCKEDYAGQRLITADTGVKAALKERGETQAIGNESTVERAQRLVDAGHEGPIWCLIMAEFEAERAGRTAIEAKFFDQITTDMERIRASGEIAELLTGGEPEVAIFWTDQHGLKMKAKLDYLTPSWWDDFKTFDNSRGKPLEQALSDFMRYNRVHVQAVTYRDAVEAVRVGQLQIIGEATDQQRALIAAIQIKPKELECWYIFQEKGGVPNLLAREFPFFDVPLSITSSWDVGASEDAQARGHDATRTSTGLHSRARTDADHAKRLFVLYSQAYDPGRPWFPLNAKARFSDLDFNTHWIEGKY